MFSTIKPSTLYKLPILLSFFWFFGFDFVFETEGQHANVKAQEAVDHVGQFFNCGREC